MGFFDRGKGPVASTKGGTGNFGRENTDGPGNAPVDYGQGPLGRKSQKEIWDMLMERWGPSPWFGRGGAQMPWSGPPGQERGQRAPRFTPDAGDPRNAGYWKNQSTPEEVAADEAAARDRYARKQALLAGDDAYQAAKASGDVRAQIAAMTALKQRMEQDRFVAQGGTPETWQNRYRNENDWPRPGVGGAVPAPGPRPAGVGPSMPPARTAAATAGASGGLPPMANPMMQGYLGGGQDSARIRPAPLPLLNPMMEGYRPSPNDVIAALSRVQSMPIGAPTAASGALGGFAKAASTSKPKAPTVVRRGGGRVDRA